MRAIVLFRKVPLSRLLRGLNLPFQARRGRFPEVGQEMHDEHPKVPVGLVVRSGCPCDQKDIACIQIPTPEETYAMTIVRGGVCDDFCAFWRALP